MASHARQMPKPNQPGSFLLIDFLPAMQQTTLSSPTPPSIRPAPSFTFKYVARHPLLLVVLLWLVVVTLAATINSSDQARNGRPTDFMAGLQLFWLLMMPLCGLSIGLTLYFRRASANALRARNIVLLYFALLLLFFPAFIYYEILAAKLFFKEEIPPLAIFLRKPNGPECWIDGMVFSAVYVVHASYALWRDAKRRMQALHAARHDNLALRLSLLQGQLEPRFLLGSLDGISDMVRDAERAQAIRALARLSDLLRNALRASQRDWLSVADEIGFLRDYLDLQTLRLGTRLQVQWDIEPNPWSGYICPALLLHQFIEQLIDDGTRDRPDDLALTLGFTLQSGNVSIQVKHSLPTGHRGYGSAALLGPLYATRERLQILYGSAANIHTGMCDDLMCVTFQFPAQEGGDD